MFRSCRSRGSIDLNGRGLEQEQKRNCGPLKGEWVYAMAGSLSPTMSSSSSASSEAPPNSPSLLAGALPQGQGQALGQQEGQGQALGQQEGQGQQQQSQQQQKGQERLIVRVDQPLEAVPLAAHTLLRGVDGGVLTPTSRKLRFRWSRSRARRACAAKGCRSRPAADLQGQRGGLPRIESLFSGRRYCSAACFLRSEAAVSVARQMPDAELARVLWERDEDSRERQVVSGWMLQPTPEKSEEEENDAWEEVGDARTYVPAARDVGHVLRIECSAVNAEDDTVSVTMSKETAPVIGVPRNDPRLLNRKMVLAKPVLRYGAKDTFLETQGGGACLRVMTYNVLAEVYATKQVYPYCPLWALSWGYRKQLIMKEIKHRDADIICLQEMQIDHFDNFLLPELTKLGYDGIIKSKTRESMGRKGKIDGCAILFKRNKIRLVEQHALEYNAVAVNMAQNGGFHHSDLSQAENSRRTDRILKRLCRDNVAQIAIFETIPEGFDPQTPEGEAIRQTGPQTFCATTTHIFWDPEYSDVKFWQVSALLQELNHIIAQSGSDLPLILCGDLNSTPDSSVVQYLSNDTVDMNHPDMSNDPLSIIPDLLSMNHGLELGSVYEMVCGREPLTTNYTAHFSGCLDYVYITANNVTPLSVLQLPDIKTLRGPEDSFLPNEVFPSDHVSLCFEVNLNPADRIRSRPQTPKQHPPSPTMTPPVSTMSPSYEQMQQYQHLKGSHMQHSPNPQMLYNNTRTHFHTQYSSMYQ